MLENLRRSALPPFRPPWWGRNPHLQTLLPILLRRRVKLNCYWQELILSDGDFIDLAWFPQSTPQSQQPLILIFHGLEGSAESPYAIGMQQALAAEGWVSCVVHFRGCGGRVNRQWHGYHSGAYQDAAEAIAHCRKTFPSSPLAAVGYSLGGNMLANYLVKVKHHPLVASVIISAPFQLAACSERINRNFSKFYQWYLLHHMKRNLLKKMAHHENSPLNPEQVNSWKTFVDFDSGYTAPAHGFKDAADYYSQCSALPLLKQINYPTLVIHSADDPFMDHRVIPTHKELSPHIEYYLFNKGGHVGFVDGTLRQPRFWLEEAVPRWLHRHMSVALTTK